MNVAKLVLGDVGRGVVAAAFGCPVTGEVLRTCGNRAGRREVVALEALDHRSREFAREIRVFPGALRNAAPAWVAGNVDHRRKRPVDAGPRGLARGDACSLPHDLRVPCRGLAERYRHDGLETVNHVAADEQGNTEAAFLDGNALQFVYRVDVHLVDDRADPPFPQVLAEFLHGIHVARMNLVHLPDLLRQRHPGKQCGNALVGLRRSACRYSISRDHGGPQ